MIKKRTPHGKFSIYPAHPFLICTVQYCPRFHFPEFDGRSKACISTRHGAWALENTRRRPPFVPSPCSYDPCISQHQTAHVRAHKPPPRGGCVRNPLRPHPQSIPPRDLYQFEKGPHPFWRARLLIRAGTNNMVNSAPLGVEHVVSLRPSLNQWKKGPDKKLVRRN